MMMPTACHKFSVELAEKRIRNCLASRDKCAVARMAATRYLISFNYISNHKLQHSAELSKALTHQKNKLIAKSFNDETLHSQLLLLVSR